MNIVFQNQIAVICHSQTRTSMLLCVLNYKYIDRDFFFPGLSNLYTEVVVT